MEENPHAQRPQAAPSVKHGAAAAWGQLLRLPNLLTVPGDPLAGYLLAASVTAGTWIPFWHVLAAGAASLFLYAGGLVLNDLCDLKEDRRDRPDRPLPSGRIPLRSAWAGYALLTLGGLLLASLASWVSLGVAVALLVVVALYNRFAKRLAVVGPLTMGLCRGLSVLLGAAAVTWAKWERGLILLMFPLQTGWKELLDLVLSPIRAVAGTLTWPPVLVAATGMTLYIAAVTQIARGETRRRSLGAARFLPAMILIAWFVVTDIVIGPRQITELVAFNVLAAAATGWAVYCALRLEGAPEPPQVQRTVGRLIRGLLLIQAALAALVALPGWIVAAVLLACWPIQAYLAKRFYSS